MVVRCGREIIIELDIALKVLIQCHKDFFCQLCWGTQTVKPKLDRESGFGADKWDAKKGEIWEREAGYLIFGV